MPPYSEFDATNSEFDATNCPMFMNYSMHCGDDCDTPSEEDLLAICGEWMANNGENACANEVDQFPEYLEGYNYYCLQSSSSSSSYYGAEALLQENGKPI